MRVSNRDGFKCVEEPVLQFVWAMDYVAQEISIVDRNSSPVGKKEVERVQKKMQ